MSRCTHRVPTRSAAAGSTRTTPAVPLGQTPRSDAPERSGRAYGSEGSRRAQSAPNDTASPGYPRAAPRRRRLPTCLCVGPGRPPWARADLSRWRPGGGGALCPSRAPRRGNSRSPRPLSGRGTTDRADSCPRSWPAEGQGATQGTCQGEGRGFESRRPLNRNPWPGQGFGAFRRPGSGVEHRLGSVPCHERARCLTCHRRHRRSVVRLAISAIIDSERLARA
jgi:hypothetical protein